MNVPHSLREQLLAEADRVCGGEIECFGTVTLNGFNWHRDFYSGVEWTPGSIYSSYKIVDLSSNSDVKVPWELSRCHQLIPPAKAYALSLDEKYAKWIEGQILDWIEENPFPRSINWTSAMDVAIRAVNWLWSIWLCRQYFEGKHSLDIINHSLFNHGLFIRANLEKNLFDYSSNHYYADLVGLIYLGVHFRRTANGNRWLKFGLKEFERETAVQFLPSGVNYELATGYHRLMTEMLLSVICLLRREGVQVSPSMLETAEKAIGYIYHYNREDGTSAQIGDADDGRLHIFGDYLGWRRGDHRYLLALGHAIFHRDEWAQEEGSLYRDAAILLNDPAVCGLAQRPSTSTGSLSFHDAGIHVLRDKTWHIVVKTSNRGPLEQHGWHTHNDVLSFELALNCLPIFVDPGVGEYSGNIVDRNMFRSTRSHNTVVVDGVEQNSYQSGISSIWSNNGEAVGFVESCEISDTLDVIRAFHNGYKRLTSPVIHRREFRLYKEHSKFVVVDRFEGSGEHEAEWSFVLHPHVIADSIDSETWTLKMNGVTARFNGPIPLVRTSFWFSSGYKRKQQTLRLHGRTQAKMNRDYRFVFSHVSQ